MTPAFTHPRPTILVAGLGSPHGDDQAGWITIEAIRSLLVQNNVHRGNISCVCCKTPVDLLHEIPGFSALFICDCATIRNPQPSNSQFLRLIFPRPWTVEALRRQVADNRIGTSTHGIDLGQALELAEIEGRFLGTEAVIYAIPGSEFSPMAAAAVGTVSAANAAAVRIFEDTAYIADCLIGNPHSESGQTLQR